MEAELKSIITSFRHHHKTGLKRLQCNESITTSHENICVISKGVDVQEYKLDYGDAMRSLVAMKCRMMTKCWTCFCTKFSVVVIESEYETEMWNELWKTVKELYDSRTPKHPKTINENKKRFEQVLDIYVTPVGVCRGQVKNLKFLSPLRAALQ